MKRYIYIILGIIIAAIIAIVILFLLRGGSALNGILPASITGLLPSVGTQGSNSAGGENGATGFGSSTSGEANSSTTQNNIVQSFNMVASGPILDYFVDPQNNITIIRPSGEIVTISGNQSSTLSSNAINNIISTGFSSDGKKLLVNFGDTNNPQTTIFDVTSKTWTALPQGLHSPRWSPLGGYQIAYLNDPGTGISALSVIDAGNLKSGTATLITLNITDPSLQWITKTQFVLSDKPSVQTLGSSWLFNSQTKALTPITYEMLGGESIWGGTTTTIGLSFFENPNSQKMEFRLEDANGNNLHDLNFLTLPTKCTFNEETSTVALTAIASTTVATSSSKTAKTTTIATSTIISTPFLYCGVPTDSSQLSSAQLPDDYNDGALFTSDRIIKLNANTGDIATLWNDSTQNMDVNDLKFANNTAYFINRYNQGLYSLVLTQQ
jgi:hypothetical protein